MPAGDPGKIRVHRPYLALRVLGDQKPHRPVEARRGLRGEKLDAEGRIAENQQRRRPQFDPGAGRELGLIDGVEERDLLVGDVGLEPPDRLFETVGALDRDDAVPSQGRRPGGAGPGTESDESGADGVIVE